jgi:hypothetical protein
MRIIDMVHSWSQGTHSTYQSQLSQVHLFEQHIGHTFLNATVLLAPPADMPIPLMLWAQEFRSVQTTVPHSSRPNAPLLLAPSDHFAVLFHSFRHGTSWWPILVGPWNTTTNGSLYKTVILRILLHAHFLQLACLLVLVMNLSLLHPFSCAMFCLLINTWTNTFYWLLHLLSSKNWLQRDSLTVDCGSLGLILVNY